MCVDGVALAGKGVAPYLASLACFIASYTSQSERYNAGVAEEVE